MEIRFPSEGNHHEAFDDKVTTGCCSTFQEACDEAVRLGLPLCITEDIELPETIKLGQQQQLLIRGSRKGDGDRKVKLSGKLHSLFLLNNRSQLILEHLDLHHTVETHDHKKVGAAVNLRSKSRLKADQCSFTSSSGFCVWAVQKCQVELSICYFVARARSSIVCFGQASCRLTACRLEDAGVHAVCARGVCHIRLQECTIVNSAARAIYAYAGATLDVKKCKISGTMHPAKAAIEVASSIGTKGGGDKLISTIRIVQTKISENKGAGIRLRGDVHFEESEMDDMFCDNVGADVEVVREEDEPRSASDMVPKRDDAGSSFRMGDWLCTACRNLNTMNMANCQQCNADHPTHAKLLSNNEIVLLNRGIDAFQAKELRIIWEFDGDDEKGWVAYDEESSLRLEESYQELLSGETKSASTVLLAKGRYMVDINTMQQINTKTQFLRLVRRRTEEAGPIR